MKLELISDWQFNHQQSIGEYQCYIQALYKKLFHQLEEYYNYIGKHSRVKFTDLKNSHFTWIAPELVWLIQTHEIHPEKMDMKTVESIESFLVNHCSSNPPTNQIHSKQLHLWKRDWIINSLSNIKNSFPRQDQHLYQLSLGTDEERFSENILQALTTINEISPSAFNEIEIYIREYVLLKGKGLLSSSVPQAFGVIYLMPRIEWNVVNYIDFIVHETAHHVLLVKTSLCKLLNNPHSYTVSPLRTDQRPIIGVLHAVFVLVRVCDVLEKWIQKKNTKLETAHHLMENYVKMIGAGLRTLHRDGEFTMQGELLYNRLLERYSLWEKLTSKK